MTLTNVFLANTYIHTYNLDIQQPHFWLISQPILQLDARGAKFFVVYLWSVNFENNLWSANFSQKKERTSLFCLLFYSSWQKNQIRLFVFWETRRLANLLFDFIWPLIKYLSLNLFLLFLHYFDGKKCSSWHAKKYLDEFVQCLLTQMKSKTRR